MAERHRTARPANGVQTCAICGTLLVDQRNMGDDRGFFPEGVAVYKGMTFTARHTWERWVQCVPRTVRAS